ncbi:MAG: carboxypeptidase-like regulatory domain-containing protein [Salinirussus sp.]
MLRVWSRVLVFVVVAGTVAPVGVAPAAADDVTLTLTLVDRDDERVGDVDATVSWEGGSENVTTRANGQALVDVPEGSRVEISITDDAYLRNAPFVVGNATGGEVTVPVSLPGTAEVTVVDSEGPVANATVTLFRNDGLQNHVTDADGTVSLDPVARETYALRVQKPGYLTNISEFPIRTEGIQRTVRLRRGAVELRFNVTDDHFDPPRPVADARVTVGETATLTTLSNGRQGTSVPVNRGYSVSVTKEGYRSASRTVEVDESPINISLTIQREPAINVTTANRKVVVGESTRLTVVDEYGEPIADVDVLSNGETVGTTSDQGTLSVEIDDAGNQTFRVETGELSDTATVQGVAADGAANATPTETATATTTPTQTTGGGGGPGFGTVAVVLALVGAVLLVVALLVVNRRGR